MGSGKAKFFWLRLMESCSVTNTDDVDSIKKKFKLRINYEDNVMFLVGSEFGIMDGARQLQKK